MSNDVQAAARPEKSPRDGVPYNPFEKRETPVTATMERSPQKGKEAQLEQEAAALAEFASRFPGYLGMEVTRPEASGQRVYRLVFRWSTSAGLEAFKAAPELQERVARINALSEDAPTVREVRGIETWFSAAGRKDAPTPPPWKLMIVSGLAIYPIISVAPGLFAPMTKHLPMWLSNIVLIIALTPIANYVTTPLLTWFLSGWLYPDKSATTPARNEERSKT